MKANIFTQEGAQKGSVELDPKYFGLEVNKGSNLAHRLLLLQQSNARVALAHTKTRGERQGSTRKIYPQKGTGRARMGSNRAPMRRKGGVALGPRSDRNFTISLNKKERRKALFTILSGKAAEGKVSVMGAFKGAKTSDLAAFVAKALAGQKIVLAVTKAQSELYQSARNLPEVKVVYANYLNPQDLLKYSGVMFTQEALAELPVIFK